MGTTYEIYALRLGHLVRNAQSNFLNPIGHDDPMELTFMCWLVRGPGVEMVVDCGFSQEAGDRRGRVSDRTPGEAVRSVGVDPADVTHLVLTHLHYDHAGNIGDFPNAQVVVQQTEIQYSASAAMGSHALNHAFEVDDAIALIRKLWAGDVRITDGTETIAPGITVHHIGGHTPGHQIVAVPTQRGEVLLLSDAAHFYQTYHDENPFPIIVDLPQMVAGWRRIKRMAESDDHVIPGHDSLIFQRYGDPVEPTRALLHRPPRPAQ